MLNRLLNASLVIASVVGVACGGSPYTATSERYYCGPAGHDAGAVRAVIGGIVDDLYDAPLKSDAQIEAKIRHDGGAIATVRSLKVVLPKVVRLNRIASASGALVPSAVAVSDGRDDNVRPIYLKFPGPSIRKARSSWVLFATSSKEKVCK